MSPILEAVFDREKTIWAHTPGGAEAERLLQRGAGAHLFDPDADLDALIRRVWTEGVFLGVIRVFERFALVSETPIGERIPKDSETLSLYCIEIKGRVIEGRWRYHLVPRPDRRRVTMSGTGKAVKIEWFFDSAAFHYEPDKAVLGLLRVFEDGSAEMTADGRQTFKRFDDAEEAGEWLTDEEFSPLDILAGAAQDEAVTPPDAAALKAQMETLLKAVK